MTKRNKRGFTLIELLVVVAILGLLATIVAVSLTSARARARDARRVSDVRQIELALELYYAAYQQYPTSTPFQALIDDGYLNMASAPVDPQSGDTYCYAWGTEPGTYPTQYYHIAATLENENSDMLTNDLDANTSGDNLGDFTHDTVAITDCTGDAEGIDASGGTLYDRGVLPQN